MPGSAGHLIRRFFDVIKARPLTEGELETVTDWLTKAELDLFLSQPVPDQRHGYEAGQHIVASGVTTVEVISAAAVHDIGKRHAHLGVFGRSAASVLILAELDSLWSRARTYRNHGDIAAEELATAGSSRLSVEFARHHHGRRPDSIEPNIWDLLVAADGIQSHR